ncbi:hypothetical protein TNCV_4039462 [Trichonephila clavipes]|nr:hypothetical protein TNCV_4039462 [Trichonephila clavipes]
MRLHCDRDPGPSWPCYKTSLTRISTNSHPECFDEIWCSQRAWTTASTTICNAFGSQKISSSELLNAPAVVLSAILIGVVVGTDTRELIEHLHNFLRGLQNRNQTIRPSSTSAFTPVPSSSNSGFHQTANCEDDDAYIDKKEGDDDSFLRYRFPLSDREKNACHIDIDMTIVPNK